MHLDTTILLDELKRIDGYPFDPAKDQPFLIELMIEFPNVNFLEELKRLKLWLLETNHLAPIRYRLLLRTWIQNASNKSKKEGLSYQKINDSTK